METLLNPIFEYWCEFYSDDNSNFLDGDLEAIQAILDYYYKVEKLEHPIIQHFLNNMVIKLRLCDIF